MSFPEELSYTAEHEWVANAGASGQIATVGITQYAADQLGDVVYVDPPQEGTEVTAGETCGEVESTKSVSDLYSPASGEVTEVNQLIADDPALVNSDPYGEGWLFKIRISEEPGDLLTSEEYAKLTQSG